MGKSIIKQLREYPTGLSVEVIEALAEFAGIGLFNFHVPSGTITLNHNITLMTGYEPGDLPHTGNTKEMLTFEEDRYRVEAAMATLFNGEADSYALDYRMRRSDGSIVSVQENAIVYEWDADGKPVRIAALAQDLSKLRLAEDKARRMEKENKILAANLGDSLYAEHNRMLSATNVAGTMIIGGLHQDYETVLKQSLQIVAESIQADRIYIFRNQTNDDQTTAFFRAHWEREDYPTHFKDGDILDYDTVFPKWRQDFKKGYYYLRQADELEPSVAEFFVGQQIQGIMLAPLFLHGEFWGLLGFDACREKRLFREDEADIMVSGIMIIASSISRNETFGRLNKAREAALASTKAKGEFLSRMSHEIRTPMNAIIGMTTIAKNAEDTERVRYCLDKVDASSRQLLSLINDVLDMSKIESGKFEIAKAPFNFERMIQNVINVIQVKLDEKYQRLRVNFDTIITREIVSDELRLSQVLINLLNNATKFTAEKGEIVVNISERKRGDGVPLLQVSVKDNGIGIAPEQQDKLFNSFEQADGSITRTYGGTGLGLSISKKIVKMLGGDIWVESEQGKGSDFIFNFELQWGNKLIDDEISQDYLRQMRILVVDDAPDVLEYFKNILGSFNLDCDTASGGAQAIAMVKASVDGGEPYDMVFVDWNMPDMNGGTTGQRIQEMCGDVIVVMISVSDWADIEANAKEYGIRNFLAKPVLPSMLYNTIVKLSDNTLLSNTDNGESQAVRDWSDKTLLLAEDIDINREIIHTLLADSGVGIVDAIDGQEALVAYSTEPQRYDLILMDMQMPVMDGITATREIRKLSLPEAQEIPIVAMTANAFKEDIETCLEAGMNGHIAKPLDVRVMMETLEKYLG